MTCSQTNHFKKVKLFTLICCFFTLLSACNVDNDLRKTRDELQAHVDEIENIIDLTSLRIKPSNQSGKNDFDEKDENNFTVDLVKYFTVDQFASYIQKNEQIDAEVIKPNNLIKVSVDVIDLKDMLGLEIEDNSLIANDPTFIPTSLHFWDGTTLAVNGNYKTLDTAKLDEENADGSQLGYNEFLIPSDKSVKMVDFDVKFRHKSFTGYRLDSVNRIVKTDGAQIEWRGNQNGEVKVSYPKAIDNRIGETFGFYKNGKMLKSSGRTSYSIPSITVLEWAKKSLPIYQKAIDLMDKQELKSKQEVDDYLAKNLQQKPVEKDAKTFATTFYSGPVDYIMIYVENAKPENVVKKVTLKLHKDDREWFNKGYFVAKDSKNKKYGIVDARGNWIINPTYDDIRAESEGKFSVYENKIGRVRKLDVLNKKFVALRD